MPADNTKTYGESHSGARFAFRAEERIEQPGFPFWSHACSRVGNAYDNAVSRLQRRHSHFSTRGHGVDGIEDYVHEHLSQLNRIALNKGVAIGMEREAYGWLACARLPAWPGHLTGIIQEFHYGDCLKLTAGTLPGKILNAADDVGAV